MFIKERKATECTGTLADGHKPDPYSYYEKQKGVSLEIVRAPELEAPTGCC